MVFATLVRQVCEIAETSRDNTGERRCVEDQMLPTTDFPSDHMIVSATLRFLPKQPACPLLEPFERASSSDGSGSGRSFDRALEGGDGDAAAGFRERRLSDASSAAGDQAAARRGRTLYDVWGIPQKCGDDPFERVPSSSGAFERVPSSHALCEDPAEPDSTKADGVKGWTYFAALDDDIEWPPERDPAGADGAEGLRYYEARLRKAIYAVSRQSSVWMLFSSCPLAIGRCKAWMLLSLAAISILRVPEGYTNVRDVRAFAPLEARHFRLVPHDTHSAFDAGAAAAGGGGGHAAEGVLNHRLDPARPGLRARACA